MLVPGLDSSSPPTLQQVRIAYNLGYRWWGFYIQDVSNTDPLRTWAPGEEANIVEGGMKPVPICIPAPPHPADPVQCATQAFESCKNYGLSPEIAICYNGSHISVNGPVWLPIPGPPPITIGPQSAIQYGVGNLGVDVDLNLATTDFPYDKGIVCDLEFNVTYDSTWYQTFQQTIVKLSQVVHVGRSAITEPIIQSSASGCQDSSGNLIRWDVILIGKNTGAAYHIWWDHVKGWHGPENLVNAG